LVFYYFHMPSKARILGRRRRADKRRRHNLRRLMFALDHTSKHFSAGRVRFAISECLEIGSASQIYFAFDVESVEVRAAFVEMCGSGLVRDDGLEKYFMQRDIIYPQMVTLSAQVARRYHIDTGMWSTKIGAGYFFQNEVFSYDDNCRFEEEVLVYKRIADLLVGNGGLYHAFMEVFYDRLEYFNIHGAR
jgi:hypothetical protein